MRLADARHLAGRSGSTHVPDLTGEGVPCRHLLLVALVGCLLSPAACFADLIGVISNSWEFGYAHTSQPNDPLYFAFGNFDHESEWSQFFWITNAVYDGYAFTSNDVGSVFYLTAAEDSDFTQLAANLVNGQADRIGYIADDSPIPIGADYGYTQNYEDYMLAGSLYLTNGIDLQGTVIDGFSLVISDLYLDSPGSDLNGDGNWTDLRFSVTLYIEGHVIPEPYSIFLFSMGLCFALLKGLRKCG